MRSLVLRSWSTGGRWYRRNGRARGQIAAAGPRERWFRRCMAAMMYMLWRSQCRWALECRQAGERQRATAAGLLDCSTAGLLDKFGASGVLMRRPRVSSRAGCAVLQCLATMQSVGRWAGWIARWMAARRCGAVRKGRGETRRETGETRHTRHTRHTRRWWQAGRPAWHCFRVAAPVHQALPQAFEKTFRITLPAVPAPLNEC